MDTPLARARDHTRREERGLGTQLRHTRRPTYVIKVHPDTPAHAKVPEVHVCHRVGLLSLEARKPFPPQDYAPLPHLMRELH